LGEESSLGGNNDGIDVFKIDKMLFATPKQGTKMVFQIAFLP
jgi:hypothetical protein